MSRSAALRSEPHPRRSRDPLPGLLALSLLLLTLNLSFVATAAAEDDGLYGRLDGDMVVSAAVGGGLTFKAQPEALAAVELRARYLDMVGVTVAGQWHGDGAGEVVLALEARPLFPIRFLLNGSLESAWLDLFIDSIGVELGTSIGWGIGGSGLALLWGAGVDLPLVLPNTWTAGVVLHVGVRHLYAGSQDQLGPGPTSSWQLLGALTVRLGVTSGLAAREPPRYR